MSQPILSASLLTLAEASLKRVLRQDPATLTRLAKLEGRVFAIHATAPSFTLFLLPHGTGIDLLGHYDGEPDVSIEGPTLLLARLPLEGNAVLFGRGVNLHGNSALAHQLRTILEDTRIDWEAWLGNLFGDTLGHEAARAIRALAGYGRDTAHSLLLNTSEYLQEEARLLPPRAEIEVFLDGVDELREAVDRLEARIEQLHERLNRAD